MTTITLQQFKSLSKEDAFEAAARISGIPANVLDSVWQQESKRGTLRDSSGRIATSPRGAKGHFQIMPRERGVMNKRLGINMNPDDFHDSLFVAAHMFQENKRKFKTVEDSLRAYNGGWTPSTWGNAETTNYVKQIMGRVGKVGGSFDISQPSAYYKPSTQFVDRRLRGAIVPYYTPNETITVAQDIPSYDTEAAALSKIKPKFTPFEKETQERANLRNVQYPDVATDLAAMKEQQLAGNMAVSFYQTASGGGLQIEGQNQYLNDEALRQRYANEAKQREDSADVGDKLSAGFQLAGKIWRAPDYESSGSVQKTNLYDSGEIHKTLKYLEDTGVNVTPEGATYLLESINSENLKHRAEYLREYYAATDTLSVGSQGASFAASLIGGMADPINLAIGIATGGGGLAAGGARSVGVAARTRSLLMAEQATLAAREAALSSAVQVAKTAPIGFKGLVVAEQHVAAKTALGAVEASIKALPVDATKKGLLTATAARDIPKAAAMGAAVGVPIDYVASEMIGVDEDFDIFMSLAMNAGLSGGFQALGHAFADASNLRSSYLENKLKAVTEAENQVGADAPAQEVIDRARENNKEKLVNAYVQAMHTEQLPPSERFMPDTLASYVKQGLAELDDSVVLDRTVGEGMIGRTELDKIMAGNVQKLATEWVAANGITPIKESRTPDWVQNLFSVGSRLSRVDNDTALAAAHKIFGVPEEGKTKVPSVMYQQHMLSRTFVGDLPRMFMEYQKNYIQQKYGTSPTIQTIQNAFSMDTAARQQKVFANELNRYRVYAEAGKPIPEGISNIARSYIDAIHESNHKMAKYQIEAGTLGSDAILNSKSYANKRYTPYKVSGAEVLRLSRTERERLADTMVKQLIDTAGLTNDLADKRFVNKVVAQWLDRAVVSLYDIVDQFNSNTRDRSSGHALKEMLERSGIKGQEAEDGIRILNRGARGHTKTRMDIDWTATFRKDDGTEAHLYEMLDTDFSHQHQRYAEQVASDVALARVGIFGKAGLDSIENALLSGDKALKPNSPAFEAWRQGRAEIEGSLYGNRNTIARNIQAVTNAALLQQVSITQLGDLGNLWAQLGARSFMKGIMDIPMVAKDVLGMAKGKPSNIQLLRDLDSYAGSIGMDNYFRNFALDNASDVDLKVKEGLGTTSRLIRAISTSTSYLNGMRLISSVSTRIAAKRVVSELLEGIKSGKIKDVDGHMRSYGFTDDMIKAVKGNIDDIATFDSKGNLSGLDLYKLGSPAMAQDFMQSVYRGTTNIIQQAIKGEEGKAKHDDMIGLLMQLRRFSLQAWEKQLKRGYKAEGAAGLVMGMAFMFGWGAVLHLGRIQLATIGMSESDSRDYIEKRTNPLEFSKSVLNYMSRSGFLSEFLLASDALTAGTEFEQKKPINVGLATVVPSVGVADRAVEALYSKDPKKIIKTLPYTNLPYVTGIINYATQD